MRELTKSMLRFSWAMPLYGMQQMVEAAMPRDMSRPFGRAADGFDAVTAAARGQLGGSLRGVFDAGDQIQRGLVEAAFSLLPMDAMNPARAMRMAADVMQRSMGAMGTLGRRMPGGPGPQGRG